MAAPPSETSQPPRQEAISDQALAALWASSLSAPLRSHGDGRGGGTPLRLTPRELEHMVLDHIDEEAPSLQPLTAARREGAIGGSFLQWLSMVPTNPVIAGQLRSAVRNALQMIIESTCPSDHGRSLRGS